MHCTNCGTLLNEGALYCTTCGGAVANGPAPQSAPPSQVYQQPADAGYPPQQYAEPGYQQQQYAEPGYPQQQYAEPRYPQQQYAEPGYPQQQYAEPGYPQQQYAEPGYPQQQQQQQQQYAAPLSAAQAPTAQQGGKSSKGILIIAASVIFVAIAAVLIYTIFIRKSVDDSDGWSLGSMFKDPADSTASNEPGYGSATSTGEQESPPSAAASAQVSETIPPTATPSDTPSDTPSESAAPTESSPTPEASQTPETQPGVFPYSYKAYNNSYSFTGYEIGEDEHGNTEIILSGGGYQVISFRNGNWAIPASCKAEADGKVYQPEYVGVNNMSIFFTFNTSFSPDSFTISNGDTGEVMIVVDVVSGVSSAPADSGPAQGGQEVFAAFIGDWEGSVDDIWLAFSIYPDGTGTYTFEQSGYSESFDFVLEADTREFFVLVPNLNSLGISSIEGVYTFSEVTQVLTLDVTTTFTTGRVFEYSVPCYRI